jgi:DNA polymerase-3 subunit epsilon
MTDTQPVLAFVDVETTGLDPRIHQPYELCVWREDLEQPVTFELPHDLVHADRFGLRVGGYWDRGFAPWSSENARGRILRKILELLQGATLVGSSPQFDAAMLSGFIGCEVWDHRLVDVAQGGMWVFGWDRPRGLASTCEALREQGYTIPAPDHTAEGDVRATRAVYEALCDMRGRF